LDSTSGGILKIETMNATDTERVIARVLSGELDAYAELIQAHQQVVWRVVAAMLLDPQQTEDLVQQTFINAYRHLGRFEPGRDFGRWLKKIAHNLVLQELRTRWREDRRLENYRRHLLATGDHPDAAAAEERLAEALAGCEQKLPVEAAQLVNLRYRRALDFSQIATQAGRTVEATRQQLARIRLALRDCIQKQLAQP
jgi:RNA polymerase sigma-70 factor (ECF subfamily)